MEVFSSGWARVENSTFLKKKENKHEPVVRRSVPERLTSLRKKKKKKKRGGGPGIVAGHGT